jgi:hypothetical protein
MAITKTNKLIRNIRGPAVEDPSSIQALTYNEQTGAQKNMDMGHHLIPLKINATTFTTDATTARAVPMGKTLAIYNNTGSAGSITLGDTSAVALLAAGATDVNGNVGIPCKPNDWTYISVYDRQYVISSAATLLVFVVKDDSSVANQGR